MDLTVQHQLFESWSSFFLHQDQCCQTHPREETALAVSSSHMQSKLVNFFFQFLLHRNAKIHECTNFKICNHSPSLLTWGHIIFFIKLHETFHGYYYGMKIYHKHVHISHKSFYFVYITKNAEYKIALYTMATCCRYEESDGQEREKDEES